MNFCKRCRVSLPIAARFCGMCGQPLPQPRKPRSFALGPLKRAGLALGLAGTIFGGVYGLASSLGVSTQTLGAGNTAVAACQATTLTATYATAYDSTIPGYAMTTITVNGLDTTSATNCASKAYKVSLTGSANSQLAETTGTTPASGTSFTTASIAASKVLAASVTGIHVTITG